MKTFAFLLIVILLTSCQNINKLANRTYNNANPYFEEGINLDKVNLREFNESHDMYNIDIFLANIPTYRNIVRMQSFRLRDIYAGFVVNEVYTDESRIRIRLHSEIEDGARARIEMNFNDSQGESAELIRMVALEQFTAPSVYRSAIDVGDFALGFNDSLTFIRGNIVITIRTSPNHDIVDLALEIDQQIIGMLRR